MVQSETLKRDKLKRMLKKIKNILNPTEINIEKHVKDIMKNIKMKLLVSSKKNEIKRNRMM